MPKPTAIQLTYSNIDQISNALDISVIELIGEVTNSIKTGVSTFYVKDALYRSTPMAYVIYTESEFLDCFASMPPGIGYRFVPVTQVKDGP